MERVETLCNLLLEKLRANASAAELLLTVKMLESELLHAQQSQGNPPPAAFSAAVKIAPIISPAAEAPDNTPASQPEKIVEVLQLDEAEVEAELEEIRKNAEDRNKISVANKPKMAFDPMQDIPTLAGRAMTANVPPAKELHETLPVEKGASVNETLRRHEAELSDKLQDSPVKDLKKAIGVNDRFRFLSELFRGDEPMYERSIKTINGFAIYAEAEYWIRRELKLKLGWDDRNETVRQFDQLVRRRFS